MKLRQIPGTEVDVSPICLGTMTFGRPVEKPEAIRLTHLALDLGINFIDTANMYEGYNRSAGSAGGVAEDILGEALVGKRDEVIVLTKVGMAVGPGDDDAGLGRKHVLREIDKSLSRLKTDYVDFYLAHRTDPDTPLEEVVDTFSGLVKAGKVRHWGLSNHDGERTGEIVRIAQEKGVDQPRLSEPWYSMLNRECEEALLPMCRKHQLGVACYRVLESGLLSGKYKKGQAAPGDSRAVGKPEWVSLDKISDDKFERIEKIAAAAEKAGLTPAQYAMAWTIAQPGITSAIIGVTKEKQLRDAIAAGECQLAPDDLKQMNDILS